MKDWLKSIDYDDLAAIGLCLIGFSMITSPIGPATLSALVVSTFGVPAPFMGTATILGVFVYYVLRGWKFKLIAISPYLAFVVAVGIVAYQNRITAIGVWLYAIPAAVFLLSIWRKRGENGF